MRLGLGSGTSARNEAVFRRINEAIEQGRWPGEDKSAFRCECARAGCSELLQLSAAEYEQVRSHPRRFVVLPGHEDLSFEDVVESSSRYLVVEKRGEAGQRVEEDDPRREGSDPSWGSSAAGRA